MIPNRCAKTRVQLPDDKVLHVYSCFVDRPDAIPEDKWVLMEDVLVDEYSKEVLSWHEVGWFMHEDTIVAAKVEGEVDPRVEDFVKETRAKLGDKCFGESKEVTSAPPLSDNTPQAPAARTSTKSPALEESMEKLSVESSPR